MVNKKISVLYLLVWKYFYYPEEKEARMERDVIETEIIFH